jgi:hypothetical protein
MCVIKTREKKKISLVILLSNMELIQSYPNAEKVLSNSDSLPA